MYFVDTNKIDKTLIYMDELLQKLNDNQFKSALEKLSLERITHIVIESMLDAGNMMIDGFIMRDPGSFNDIIDILVDEQVLPEEESENYKQVIGLRNMLVKDYLEIDHNRLFQVITNNHHSLAMYSQRVRDYLRKENSGATAFYNT